MRGIFSVLGLLVVVLIIALLAKKQLGGGTKPSDATNAPAGVTVPSGTAQQQVQQYKQAVEGAMQQARPMPDDAK